MKSITAIIFALLVAVAAASVGYDGYRGDDYYRGDYYRGGYYGDGFRRTPYGVEARYNNAERQQRVNHIAEKVGASSGTARYYGVPGTGRYFPRYYEHKY